MNKEKYYVESGKYTTISILIASFFGVLGSVLLGLIYGYLIHYIQFIYFNFLITCSYGAAIGMLVTQGAKIGKIRNSLVCKTIIVIVGISAIYISWVAWIYAMSEQALLFLNPLDIWQYAKLLSQVGIWEIELLSQMGVGDIESWTPLGWQLFLIWIGEATLIIGSALIIWKIDIPFCEKCHYWTKKMDNILIDAVITNKQQLIDGLEKSDIDLVKHALKKIEGDSYTKIEVFSCPKCCKKYYITIYAVSILQKIQDKAEITEDVVVKQLIVTKKNYEGLKSLS